MSIVSINYPIRKNREKLNNELKKIRAGLQNYNNFFYYPYKDAIHNLREQPNVSTKLLQRLHDRQNVIVDRYFQLRDQEEKILKRIYEIDRLVKSH